MAHCRLIKLLAGQIFWILLVLLFVHGQGQCATAPTQYMTVFGDARGDVTAGSIVTTEDAISTNNSITVLAMGIVASLYSGYAKSSAATAEASNNTVNSLGTLGNLFAGYAEGSTGATSFSNSVIVGGGSISGDVFASRVTGTSGSATAYSNTLTINGGSITGSIYGAYADSLMGTTSATSNTVTVNNGSVGGSVYGGFAYTSIGSTATASGNTVNIAGGTVSNDVIGGKVQADIGGTGLSATGNTVNISGGSVLGNVYGGYVSTIDPSAATGNTVTLSGSPTFGGATVLAGGEGSGSGDLISNNRLNVWNYTGSSVGSVKNFQYYNFLLPTSFTTSSAQALNITGNLSLTTGSTSSTVEAVDFQGGGSVRSVGDVYTLLRAGSITGAITNDGQTITGKHGAALVYNILLTQNANTVTATILSNGSSGSAVSVNPQMKAVSEGRTSGAIAVNQGADLVAGQGVGAAVAATRGPMPTSGAMINSFGTMAAGSSTYHTGSHVDVSGFSLAAGVAAGVKTAWGDLTVAPFFEYGSGSYNTYNSFNNAASVTGDGNTYYMGGGLLARLDFFKLGPGHFYTEGSARIGNVHNHYSNDDLQDGFGRSASFDADATYYGLHAGVGYVWNINEALALDMYSKYFWTRQEANSVTLSTGDPVEYDAVDSNRLRFGTRMSYSVDERFSPYIGAAYEREFNGKAEATTYGYSIPAPSMRGDTGIGELGVMCRPLPNLPLTIDLAAQGYVGKREGITGSLQVRYEF